MIKIVSVVKKNLTINRVNSG